jgi:hypothetical protein
VRVANEVANEDGYGLERAAVHAAPSPGSHMQTPAGHVWTVSCARRMRRSKRASASLVRVLPQVTVRREVCDIQEGTTLVSHSGSTKFTLLRLCPGSRFSYEWSACNRASTLLCTSAPVGTLRGFRPPASIQTGDMR